MKVTKAEFDAACKAVWSEIEYQNSLDRRTEDFEAKDIPGFATLGHRYLRQMEDAWCDNAGILPAQPCLRKLAAIFVRGMIYCGYTHRC